jgi:hypothetical protein
MHGGRRKEALSLLSARDREEQAMASDGERKRCPECESSVHRSPLSMKASLGGV